MTDYSFQTLHSDGGARVIFRGVVGSRAYGTDRPLDYVSLDALGTRAREKSAFDAALAAQGTATEPQHGV